MQESMSTYAMKDIKDKESSNIKQPALNQAMDTGSAGKACGLGSGGLGEGIVVREGGPKRG